MLMFQTNLNCLTYDMCPRISFDISIGHNWMIDLRWIFDPVLIISIASYPEHFDFKRQRLLSQIIADLLCFLEGCQVLFEVLSYQTDSQLHKTEIFREYFLLNKYFVDLLLVT